MRGEDRLPKYVLSATKGMAARLGRSQHGTAMYAHLKRSVAAQALGLGWVDSQPDPSVYVVVLRGNFTHSNSYVPLGMSGPTGTFAVFTIDAREGILDVVIGNHEKAIPGLQTFEF